MEGTDTIINLLADLRVGPQLMSAHHERDGRCAVCRGGNACSGRSVWPCNPYLMAAAAADLQLQRLR